MTLLSTLPWELAPDLPWRFFTPPWEKMLTQPTFVIGEYLFISLAALCLWHAWRQDVASGARRRHVVAWFGALLAGTANDVIFMALPLVDNFWQAQGTIMLTPRLPLYIPCVYVCFMYIPAVTSWRIPGLTGWARAAASGLLGALFYAPYDIVGAKFLWWTWHDSDKPIATRLLGAPVGSTLWVLTFVGAFTWLLSRGLDKGRTAPLTRGQIARTLGMVAGLSTLLMMVQMTALQQLDGGSPAYLALVGGAIVYGALVLRGWIRRAPGARPADGAAADRRLAMGVGVYFATLASLMVAFAPETHQSTSLHQTYGPCGVETKDITGMTRFKYVCAEQMDEDFTFECTGGPPPPETQWYTVCGRAHTNRPLWIAGTAGLGLVGILLFAGVLRRSAASA